MKELHVDKSSFSNRQIVQFARDGAAGLMELRHFGFQDEIGSLIQHGIDLCKFLLAGYQLTQKEVDISFDDMPTWKAFQETASKKPLINGDNLASLIDKAGKVREQMTNILEAPSEYLNRKDEIIECERFFVNLLNGLTESTV